MVSRRRSALWVFPDRSVIEIVEAARVAEAEGVDMFWLGDEGMAREPFSTLAAVASVTERIELGVAAVNPYLRHPALTASTAATLSEASGRAVRVAFARGGRAALDPVGIRPEHPLRTLSWAMAVARAVLEGRPTEGYIPSLLEPKLGVELWMAGRGPAIARLAGRTADGFFANLSKPAIGPILRSVREAGNPTITLCLPVVLSEQQRELIRPYMALAMLDAPAGTPESVGSSREEAEAAAAALASGDVAKAAALISDTVLENLAVVGDGKAAAREFARLAAEHRVDEVGAAAWGQDFLEAVEDASRVVVEAAGF